MTKRQGRGRSVNARSVTVNGEWAAFAINVVLSGSVTALNKTAAKRNAEGVLRALADMGLPGHKISLSSTTSSEAENNEVRIFVR